MTASDPSTVNDEHFLRRAIDLSRKALDGAQGGPFGAVVARGGEVIGEGWNRVLESHDPTAHAEVTAIRAACAKLGSHTLEGATLYTSCEPCPMCLASALWARVDRIVWANSRADAAAIGFDDSEFYEQVALPPQRRKVPSARLLESEARAVFESWVARGNQILY